MDYFLLIETIKKVKDKEEKRKKFMDAIERYEKKSAGLSVDAPEAIIFGSMHHWKGSKISNISTYDAGIMRFLSEILLTFFILIVHPIVHFSLCFAGVVNLTDEELGKHIERSQDDILLSLTPLFEAFLESPYFQEVKEQESREEKRRFSTQSLGPEMRPKEKFVNS